MENNTKNIFIKEIFEHEEKFYIYFKKKDSDFDFLFAISLKNTNQSLFYGENFEPIILKSRKTPNNCIECALGIKVKGGVSFDNNSIIDFNLNINEANDIIATIIEYLKKNNQVQLLDRIRFFKNLT